MFLLHLFLYLDLKEALNEVKENNEYSCDGSLVPNENPCQFKFLVHCDLAWHMSREVAYYSAKSIKLPTVCFYFGGASGVSASFTFWVHLP